MPITDTWQPLLVPTRQGPDGLLRVADNDGSGVSLLPRAAVERPSAHEPDWTREHAPTLAWLPGRKLLLAVRDYGAARRSGRLGAGLLRRLAVLRHHFWAAVSGAEVPLNAERIEGGLMMPHPNGVVIHPEVRIGPNCLLFQQVTLGAGPRPGVPKLGGGVEVGPGAKILGGVVIGDHAVIGANAVVIDDVPPGAVAVGIPAVVKHNARRALHT